MQWKSHVRYIPLVGPQIAKKLVKLDIYTVLDLLWHLPVRYADFSLVSPIAKVQEGETVTVKGKVISANNEYRRGRFTLQKIEVTDQTDKVLVTWFNQPFLVKNFPIGTQVSLSGKVERFGHTLQLTSPEYEIAREDKPLLHTGRLVPIYPETAGISSKWLRNRIYYLLNQEFINDYLPQKLIYEQKLLPLTKALFQIHFPEKLGDVEPARKRLAFDELFLLQLGSLYRRRDWQQRRSRQALDIKYEKVEEFKNKLPFTLTNAQNRALSDILADLKRTTPMNRLVQGDVGSGKTVVSAIAMYVAYLNNYQSLLMAPTEILAEQHYKTLTTLLSPFGITVGLRTGSNKSQKSKVKSQNDESAKNENSEPDILVGTHALLEKKVQLRNVELIVIDEQHRFGVRQRALLREKGTTPHVLTMTATPIPRTVALTVYGDLDLSVIDEMPQGRKPVKTWVVPPFKRQGAYEWIKKQLTDATGKQAFIICPFIELSETMTTVKAVKEEYKRLKQTVFPDLSLGLLHGRMNSKEKQQVLTDFRNGKYHILVATPVVEVGIDIPAAAIILIEAAERFGLAQLHQLRGRVGRRNMQSYCLLFTSSGQSEVARLRSLEKTHTGAELADIDLKFRGPGQLFGTQQHGREFLKIASLSDLTLFTSTRDAAKALFATDPSLSTLPLLKERILSGTIAEVAPD